MKLIVFFSTLMQAILPFAFTF